MTKYLFGFSSGILFGAVGLGLIIAFMIDEDPAWCHDYVDMFHNLTNHTEDQEKQES